jgi:hypothetical protein
MSERYGYKIHTAAPDVRGCLHQGAVLKSHGWRGDLDLRGLKGRRTTAQAGAASSEPQGFRAAAWVA